MQSPPDSWVSVGRPSPAAGAPRLLLILSLLILGLGALRLVGLDHLLVWHDEVFTLVRVFGYSQAEVQDALFSGRLLSPADLLRFQHPDPGHTWMQTLQAFAEHPEHAPLYYVLARLATDLPLDPVTAVRGVSACSGLLLIPAVFWLIRELGGRGLLPWVAASLVAASPLQFLYAQEARQYALWTLCVVVASAALVRALRRDTPAAWWLYGVGMALGLYAHLLFVLMIPVHALHGLLMFTGGSWTRTQGWRLARHWVIAVVGALILFIPWLWVVIEAPGRVGEFTAWMQRPIGMAVILSTWAHHLARLFVDLSPQPPGWLPILLLLPFGWILLRFVRQAPRPPLVLLSLTLFTYLGVVLGPDLLLGGSRSLHARYALPALLMIQLMMAWVIGSALAGDGHHRPRWLGVLALFIGLGGLSQFMILRADTWWTKNFSDHNAAVAQFANGADQTLVVASDLGIGSGELISLAYHLDPRTRIWGQVWGRPLQIPTDFGRCVALTPSSELREALGAAAILIPFPGTWQWFVTGPLPPTTAPGMISAAALVTPHPSAIPSATVVMVDQGET